MNTVNCPSCGSGSSKELFWARDYVLPEEKEYRLVECSNCHLAFLNPQPTEEELKRFYPWEYFHSPEDKVRAATPSFMMLDKVKETMRFKKKGMLLDIGCGQGGFLQQMQQQGFEVHGLDLSPAACQLASEKVGKDNIFEGDLFSVNLAGRCYDVVTLWHVIEHLSNPVKALRRIRALLKDDGLLVICCPDFSSWLRSIFKGSWYPLSVPHHLCHFTPRTLTRILEITGYTIERRKRHFIDPFSNMGCLKLTILRSLGLTNLTRLKPLGGEEADSLQKRNFLWRIARFWFNMICFLLSLILSVFGNEESIMVWAFKKNESVKE